MNFVSKSIYQKATQLAIQEGIATEAIAPHLQLLAESEGEKYVPLEWLWAVYQLAGHHLAEGFGLRFGQILTVDDYGTLGLSWKTCWTARDILARTERYMLLITNLGTIRVEDAATLTKLLLYRNPSHKGLAISNETTFVMFCKIIRDVTGSDLHPRGIFFSHDPPLDMAPYESYFQCPVHFHHPENAMHFSSADLQKPTTKADKSLQHFLVERMEEESKGIPIQANKLMGDIQELIKEALPSGIPSVIDVARHLGMSSRTLKRRLADNDLTFRDLVQQTQADISRHLLKTSNRTIGEIAFQTGYSEQSAFNRAFKRWTGQTPISYRKAS